MTERIVDAFDKRLLLIFFIPFVVYMANMRHIDSGDTTPTIFVSIFTVKYGTIFLDGIHEYIAFNQLPYFLSERHGRIVSNYPIFPGLMAAPIFAPFVWMGMISPGDGNLVWDYLSKLSASAYTSLAILLLYLTLRRLLSKGQALTLAYAFAFGTALWPIASQSLWQHTGSVFWWCASFYALVRSEQEEVGFRRNLFLALCGAAVGCAVLCRINNLIGVGVFAAAVFWRRGWTATWFAAPMAALIGALIAYNLLIFGAWQGGVTEVLELRWHLDRVEGDVWSTPLVEGLAGVLFSPSRGVFIFSPFLLFALAGMIHIWRRPEPEWRSLAPLTLAAPLMLAALAKYIVWWGGIMHYGPRYPIDAYPFIIIALAAVWPTLCKNPWLRAALAALIVYSIWVQWVGAYCYPGQWAVHPVSLSEDKSRLWDWSYNQIWDSFLSGVKSPWT